jgi:hypothetical protein
VLSYARCTLKCGSQELGKVQELDYVSMPVDELWRKRHGGLLNKVKELG